MNRSTLHLLRAALIGALALPLSATAGITLKQVQITSGSQIDLLFDGKVTKAQIETDFFNDIVQVVLKDTSVYPAKISSMSGGEVTKVFAYQYAPKLVRCRFSVKGKAEDYKNQISLTPNGKILTIRFAKATASSDEVSFHSAAPVRELAAHETHGVSGATADFVAPVAKTKAATKPLAKVETAQAGIGAGAADDEKALLDKVMKDPTPSEVSKKEAIKAESSEDLPLTGRPKLAAGKPLPSPFMALGKLIFVLAVFGVFALTAKKFLNKNPSGNTLLTKISANLGLGKALGRKKGKMIEVITTHYLGPKKSLAVIRVAGKNMVIGITGDSINLISHLSSDSDMGEELLEDLNDAEMMGEIPAASTPPASKNPMAAKSQVQPKAASAADPYPNAKIKMPIDSLLEASGPAVFSDILKGHAKQVVEQNYGRSVASSASATANHTARSQIKNRLEGLKPL